MIQHPCHQIFEPCYFEIGLLFGIYLEGTKQASRRRRALETLNRGHSEY